MKRFLGLWMLLALVQWVAATLLDFAVLHAIDWRFESFCEAILLPAVGAAAIAATLSGAGASRGAAAPPAGARGKWILVPALAGAAVVAAGWLVDPRSLLSLRKPLGAPNVWFSIQLAAAAALGAAVALRRAWTARERAWLLLASAFALAAAARQVVRWAGTFSDRSPFGAGPFLPALAIELAFLGAAVGIALKASTILGRAHPLSGQLLEASTFFPVAVAAIVAIGVFRHPRLSPAWSALSASLLLVGALLALASALLAWRARPAGDSA